LRDLQKSEKIEKTATLRHDVLSIARESSAAPAATFIHGKTGEVESHPSFCILTNKQVEGSMASARRTWTIGFATIFVILISVWLAYRWYTKYDREYKLLRPGTTKAEVLGRFGKPYEDTKCSFASSWDGQPVAPTSATCVEEFEYSRWLRIGEWDIGFDADGRVVTKVYQSSP